MKRILAWIMTLVLLAGVMPVLPAHAAEAIPIAGQTITYINPRYADVVDASQLNQPGAMLLEEVEYHESIESAGLALREAMKARQTTIQIGIKLTEVPDSLFNDLVAVAEAHTGDPVEGDYICWQYKGMSGSSSGYVMGMYQYLTLTLEVTYYTTAAEEAQVDTAVDQLLAELDVWSADDYTKVKTVYDWICANITYDYEHLPDNSYFHMRTAYGGIIDRTCVCQGYAVLLYRLLLELDVDNRFIGGTSNGEGHAWNIVKLGGVYYNLDSTWDAPLAVEGYEYEHFLLTDGTFPDHTRDPEYTTAAFYSAYPMAESDYVPGETVLPDDELDPDTPGGLVAQGTWAENVTWSLAADGTLTISGSGRMESDDRLTNRGTPWDDYKEQITAVVISDGITNIASDAFSNCVNLTDADIPDSITVIDAGAFYGCTALESIYIPDSVSDIGSDAYYGCNSVTEVVIPETVKTVGDYAFSYCENLESITIPGTLGTVPYGLTIGCPKLTTVALGEGITKLTGGVFANCTALENITIPTSVTTIGDYSFSGSGLTEITFLGDAPTFGTESVFADTTVTAYYTAGNPTWNDAVKQNFGGAVTWVAVCPGHIWDEGVITTEPTVDTEGERTFTCTVCGETMTESIPKLEEEHTHSFDTWETDEYQHWQVCECGETTEKEDHTATYMACGQTGPCDVCGAEFVWDQEHEDADSDDFCDACYWPMDTVAGGLLGGCVWSLQNDGILLYAEVDENWLPVGEMPSLSSAEDYPWYPYRDQVQYVNVLGINVGDHAFQGYPVLYGVRFSTDADTGEAVSAIGAEAFADNAALEYIVFSDKAPEIAGDSFANVTAEVEYDGSWDEDLLENYGGDLTWISTGEEPHEHSYTETVTAPTCTEEGYTTYTCECGESYTDDYVDALGHSFDTWESDDYQHWQVCECGETTEKENHDAELMACGQTTLCDGCGVEIVWDRAHEDTDGDEYCDTCGWMLDVVAGGRGEGWLWCIADGWLMISGEGEMPAASSAEDYPWYRYRDVVEVVGVLGVDIGDHAFQGYPNLTMALLGADDDSGKQMEKIGAEAFADNNKLEFVEFWDEAPEIAEDAFRGVTATVEYDGTWDERLLQNYGGSLTWTVAGGEEEHEHSYTRSTVRPSCTEQGYTRYVCECGDSYVDDYTDPLGHSWNDGEVTREPTVDAVGVMTYTCTACGETRTSNIPKLEDPNAIKPHSARARLTGDEALAYDALVPFLREIAAGTRTSTEVKIGEGDGIDAEVKFTVKKDDFDYSAVIKALQIDFPYELYWNNYYANSVVQTHTSQRLVSITFRWQVDEAYRGSSEFATDPDKLAPAHTALANANAIAAKYDGKTDYEKLHGYWKEIMELTEYASDREIPEKDIRPWQLVSVFDGDPSTKVICEGYSKAFQYLCDLGGLVCYPVEGTLPGGDHQWNIVTLDGVNYLVDVTNSEPGLSGQDGTLFLAGASGSVADGYTHINSRGQETLYTYQDDDIALWGEAVLTLSNHAYTCTQEYTSIVTDPTCTEQGYTTHTCPCGYSYQDEFVDPLGHSWKDGSCRRCGVEEPKEGEIIRLAGANRFDTAFMVADQLKEELGVEKFDAIIVASGTNFADALSGSYLSAVKNAPILLSFNNTYNDRAKNYIRANLKPGGTVYILGGPAAVPVSMESGLAGFNVKRLAGDDRFGTNLAILAEAGVGDKDVLVCTGLSFADSLSASACEKPILLVWKKLTDAQKAFLDSLEGNDLYVIGGESAVSADMEKQVSAYGKTERVGGSNRFMTSVLIAEKFFDSPSSAVLAYAWNYPDGLCGGALAAALDAPLILTMTKYENAATGYVQSNGIGNGFVLGSSELISEPSVEQIFGVPAK